MMTRSGVDIRPFNDAAPPIEDIALSLSRQPRFGGHAIRPWSVAEHSMVCAGLVKGSKRLELYALLHDAHESVTADVPTTWKTDEIRMAQRELDKRIFKSLGIPPMSDSTRHLIKQIDHEVLLAEAKVVGPPGAYERIVRDMGGCSPAREIEAVIEVQRTIHQFDEYRSAVEVEEAYLLWVRALLITCQYYKC